MTLDLTYPGILDLFPEHLAPTRSESASFLIWYLEHYYRLDTGEAIDSVCDQKNDRGVDGVFVNDDDRTITIFQSKISQKRKSSIGDKPLREFLGTLTQFSSASKLQGLVQGAGAAEVAALVKRLDLFSKLATHEVKAEFIANIEMDNNGRTFLDTHPNVRFVGAKSLLDTYISDERSIPKRGPRVFDISGFPYTKYVVDLTTSAVLAPIKAKELVELDGISDQSIYAYNVRGPLGRTGVNKDIVQSIKTPDLHKKFPLFHNGITVIAETVQADDDSIEISNYFVVNGCQSLTALHENSAVLTDDLRILTKFIRADPNSDLAKKVTAYSNNQNGVKARDFRANNPIQIRLQNEFQKHYSGAYQLEIKRGDTREPVVPVLSNEDVGLMLVAFDLGEPWITHRKYQVFDNKYAEVFGRPEVTADRIVMIDLIMSVIKNLMPDIKNVLLAKYVLTRYLLLYAVRKILENDQTGKSVLVSPSDYVRTPENRVRFSSCLKAVLAEVVIDLNAESSEWPSDFDYRDKLRDAEWARSMAIRLAAEYGKQVIRKRAKSLGELWAQA